ncbi:hypothetical protein HPB48_019380 [Haemaphysalis longicornis]|uniref:Uncharacterized protein n=1 Tax=Haemaphysalis longicornis TaxID=44386 RepID=A0A9J6G651_HAELO|nr:hypothetical protein HPB48_019380 [Haemaphysalis longicornis]
MSIKNKVGLLQQYTESVSTSQDVIALQETNAHAKLPAYSTHEDSTGLNSCMLIKKSITAIHHAVTQAEQTGILTELIPRKAPKGEKPACPSLSTADQKIKQHCIDRIAQQSNYRRGLKPSQSPWGLQRGPPHTGIPICEQDRQCAPPLRG